MLLCYCVIQFYWYFWAAPPADNLPLSASEALLFLGCAAGRLPSSSSSSSSGVLRVAPQLAVRVNHNSEGFTELADNTSKPQLGLRTTTLTLWPLPWALAWALAPPWALPEAWGTAALQPASERSRRLTQAATCGPTGLCSTWRRPAQWCHKWRSHIHADCAIRRIWPRACASGHARASAGHAHLATRMQQPLPSQTSRHPCASGLHNYTITHSQLHNYTITQLHIYTRTQLCIQTITQLHNYTITQLHTQVHKPSITQLHYTCVLHADKCIRQIMRIVRYADYGYYCGLGGSRGYPKMSGEAVQLTGGGGWGGKGPMCGEAAQLTVVGPWVHTVLFFFVRIRTRI